MVTKEMLQLEGAYDNQRFEFPIFKESEGYSLIFDVEVDNTYVKRYSVDLVFEDDADAQIFDGVEPSGFFTQKQLKEIETVLFSKEVRDELVKQKRNRK